MTLTSGVMLPAAWSADDIAQLEAQLEDAATQLADRASDLRASGVPWSAIARALVVAVNSAKERYGCRPRPLEITRFVARVGEYGVTGRVRVTVWRRFIVADLGEPQGPAGTRWRIVRHCATEGEAQWLAQYLADSGPARYVKSPKDGPDGDEGRVVAWAYGPGA